MRGHLREQHQREQLWRLLRGVSGAGEFDGDLQRHLVWVHVQQRLGRLQWAVVRWVRDQRQFRPESLRGMHDRLFDPGERHGDLHHRCLRIQLQCRLPRLQRAAV
jgi:hypothetical protein